jgi:hypothetical protein
LATAIHALARAGKPTQNDTASVRIVRLGSRTKARMKLDLAVDYQAAPGHRRGDSLAQFREGLNGVG